MGTRIPATILPVFRSLSFSRCSNSWVVRALGKIVDGCLVVGLRVVRLGSVVNGGFALGLVLGSVGWVTSVVVVESVVWRKDRNNTTGLIGRGYVPFQSQNNLAEGKSLHWNRSDLFYVVNYNLTIHDYQLSCDRIWSSYFNVLHCELYWSKID